jgi:CDP-diacylglycerol--glycerol-3-phosphate 3-phosphatidyltransferase
MATVSRGRPPVFSLPNQLTAARFVLALVLFFIITEALWLPAIVVFAVAAFTDWLDGYLARKQGLSSTLGRNLDPLVDKILICGAYIFLLPFGMKTHQPDAAALGAAGEGWLVPWMVTVIVGRELVITSLRSFMENRGVTFGADWLGKLKMGLQCAGLFAIFAALWAASATAPEQLETNNLIGFLESVRNGLIWAMLAATALSGLQYLWRAASVLKVDWES